MTCNVPVLRGLGDSFILLMSFSVLLFSFHIINYLIEVMRRKGQQCLIICEIIGIIFNDIIICNLLIAVLHLSLTTQGKNFKLLSVVSVFIKIFFIVFSNVIQIFTFVVLFLKVFDLALVSNCSYTLLLRFTAAVFIPETCSLVASMCFLNSVLALAILSSFKC